MAKNSYDAVIIGAGLSGPIATRRAAEAGRNVLVLEKEEAVGSTHSGPILNTAVMTNSAPSYSPDGTALVEASVLLSDHHVTDEEARTHPARIWAMDASELELIERDDIAHSLPDHPAGAPSLKSTRLGDRTLLAGDHRATPSIEGALEAGIRAAKDRQLGIGEARRWNPSSAWHPRIPAPCQRPGHAHRPRPDGEEAGYSPVASPSESLLARGQFAITKPLVRWLTARRN